MLAAASSTALLARRAAARTVAQLVRPLLRPRAARGALARRSRPRPRARLGRRAASLCMSSSADFASRRSRSRERRSAMSCSSSVTRSSSRDRVVAARVDVVEHRRAARRVEDVGAAAERGRRGRATPPLYATTRAQPCRARRDAAAAAVSVRDRFAASTPARSRSVVVVRLRGVVTRAVARCRPCSAAVTRADRRRERIRRRVARPRAARATATATAATSDAPDERGPDGEAHER